MNFNSLIFNYLADFEDEEFLFISEVALLLEKIPDSQKNNK